jgi:pyruvate dehydrogenase E2 component (dihydrolipoamide acetyltransferase)
MAEIIMPKMGDAMTEGKVVRWYKQAGDAVKKGEPVLEIETDKVNLDLEAEQDGTLADVGVQEGQMVPVGRALASILATGETAKGSAQRTASNVQEKAAAPKEPLADKPATLPREDVVTMAQAAADRRRSSPLARRMAKDLGVSLDAIQGSGPGGRIIASDVERAKAKSAVTTQLTSEAAPAADAEPGRPQGRFAPAAPLQDREIPLTAMRRTIARRLAESTGPIPHFYLTADFDVTALLSLWKQFNQIEGVRVTINDFIIRAAALALRHHPMVNASFSDEAIRLHGDIHIGVAVSTPEGLITPVVRNADRKAVPEIASEVRTLAEKAKNRKLKPEEYQGSTFTISNLGAWGIEEFTAIIDPPNVAILAVGAAAPRAVVVEGQVVIRDRMKVTMSCDHRVVDGAAGAEYLKTLRQYVEQPLRLIVSS